MESKRLDIIVLGATGFTGKCIVKTLASLTLEKYYDISWGICGRSQENMQNLKMELHKSNLNIKNVSVLQCDIHDQESLHRVFRGAKIIINCTGPYTTMSLPVVQACIEAETHYIDISTEMFHILTTYRDCNKIAEDAGVLVIPACGFVAIPFESAMTYLQRQFEGTLNTVECYTEFMLPKRAYLPGRTLVHDGTWTSAMYAMQNFKDHIALWKQLFPNTGDPEPEEMKKSFFHRHNGKIWFPYPGPDIIVADISQKKLFQKTQKKPAHIKIYTTVPKFLHLLIAPIILLCYYLCYFDIFRKLLIKFPGLFTLGYLSRNGNNENIGKDFKFEMVLNGKGWDLGANFLSKPNKTLSVKVSGTDPTYNSTAIAVIMCAITVLKEKSNMPKGGVVMPGEAFYQTNIVERLMDHDYKFEVMKCPEKQYTRVCFIYRLFISLKSRLF